MSEENPLAPILECGGVHNEVFQDHTLYCRYKRITTLLFCWYHEDGLLFLLEAFSVNPVLSNNKVNFYRGVAKVDGKIVYSFGLVYTAASANSRGITVCIPKLSIPFYNPQEPTEILYVAFTSNSISQDYLKLFADTFLAFGTQMTPQQLRNKAAELQEKKASVLFTNQKTAAKILRNCFELLFEDQISSASQFNQHNKNTAVMRDITEDKVRSFLKTKLESGDRIPNFWGIDLKFVSKFVKRRHYYIVSPSNYGKTLFVDFLSYYYNAGSICPSVNTHVEVNPQTQILVVDEFKRSNCYSLSSLNLLADNNFGFKKLYENQFKANDYVVFIFSNDYPDTVLTLSESERTQLSNRFFLIDLTVVQDFHETDFLAHTHNKVAVEWLEKWSRANDPLKKLSLASLLTIWQKYSSKKFPEELDVSVSSDLSLTFDPSEFDTSDMFAELYTPKGFELNKKPEPRGRQTNIASFFLNNDTNVRALSFCNSVGEDNLFSEANSVRKAEQLKTNLIEAKALPVKRSRPKTTKKQKTAEKLPKRNKIAPKAEKKQKHTAEPQAKLTLRDYNQQADMFRSMVRGFVLVHGMHSVATLRFRNDDDWRFFFTRLQENTDAWFPRNDEDHNLDLPY